MFSRYANKHVKFRAHIYIFYIVVRRSDSYLGVDLMEDIKLDVQEAREARTDHPQWDFEVIFTFIESVARSRY